MRSYVFVKAVDKAGNSLTDSVDFIIEPLVPPTLSGFPDEITEGSLLTVEGKTVYGSSQIKLFIKKEGEEASTYTIDADKNGFFTSVVDKKFTEGDFTAWAQVIDSRGAHSGDSEKAKFKVTSAGFFKIGSMVIGYLSVIFTLLLLCIAILLLLLFAWKKITEQKRNLRQETSEAHVALTRAFATLREEVKTQIALLDGKPELSEQERKIYARLREALRMSEKYIERKIKSINTNFK